MVQLYDVVIVGAGPAGSSAAISLARRGYAVALVDKRQFPRDKLCGDFVNPAIWPIYREFGVDQEILAHSHEKISSVRVTTFSGEQVILPFPQHIGEAPYGLSIRRRDLDYVLLQGALRQGVCVLQRCAIKKLSKENENWRLDADHEGVDETLGARILIGADGRNSWVAHHTGLDRQAAAVGGTVGLQFQLKNFHQIPGRVEIHVFPGGYAGLVQLGDGTANLCLSVARDRLPAKRSTDLPGKLGLSQNPFLRQLLRDAQFCPEARSAFPVYFPPRRSYADRLLLVGDAARVIEPVTGEGVYCAAASGLLAAQAIDQAFRRGDFGANQLSLCERAFRQAFRQRRQLNRFIQYLIYRPALLRPLIRFSSGRQEALAWLVKAICLPDQFGLLARQRIGVPAGGRFEPIRG
jgi:geranylgeranyl reductase family protein